ncbi:hypothetical protein [Chitinophaga sp. sic0106]|uniref:hypothetical protein n=1 Tax=Chitinophaga sp. sic0106 TaxID=2854785 RepID=UPI001C48ADEC|nr:hypothetical protein [Chitinophaga sp. sic0106]MBV7530981.1 hypothetical protein [Chitinophaga sp. sic0106]
MRTEPTPPPSKVPFLTIKGNITYDYFYQSNIDTPFAERNIHQHTLQTNLSITVRNRYPVQVSFSTQQGNSSLFNNLTGGKISFNSNDFKNQLFMNARKWVVTDPKRQANLDKFQQQLDDTFDQLNKLKSSYNSNVYTQQSVEARELLYLRARDTAMGRLSSFKNHDSLYQSKILEKEKYNRELDSLGDHYDHLKQQYDKTYQGLMSQKTRLLNALQHSKNNKALTDALDALQVPDSVLPKGYKTLLAIRNVGIGRSMVDYSELTARNISITGVQLELNPSWYLAVASGTVDYTFRNFIIREKRSPQYLNLIRTGLGQRESSHIYLTYYTGKKELYGANATPADPSVSVDNHLMGIALEGQWQLGRQTYVTGEIAKSSLPFNVRKGHGQGNLQSMLNFDGHSNEAWSIGIATMLSRTATRLTGSYRQMGSNFQSFSLYTTGSQQTAWVVQVDQPLFKEQLLLSAALRKNSYSTYFEPAAFESNTLFKRFQISIRVPRLPFITLAYQPTSQLVKLSDQRFTEQIFHTLTGTATYNYRLNEVMMNTLLAYSRFFNQDTDSTFVYFNSTNFTASQTIFLHKLTLTGQLNTSITNAYNLYTASGDVNWQICYWLQAGGSVQHNYQSKYNLSQLGYGMNIRLRIPYVGDISGSAQKRYLPGSSRQLVSNNTGRITYTKIF